jgi:hypothetical protein
MTTPTTVQVRFQFRADTAANWTSIDPVLLANELGRETDTGKIKIGDGTTAWSSLGYQALGRISDADIATDAEIAVSKLANGTANQILTTDGTDVSWTDNPTIAGNVIISGNLTVNGTETIINVDTLQVEDKTIEMGVVATPTDLTADGGGIVLKGATDKTITWSDTTDAWTSSERFDFPAGTAGAPSIILNGDVNSGIYQPGADQVAISTGGTGRLFVDASGNVGVGSATIPRGPLSIYNSIAPLIHFWNNTTTSGSGNGTSLYGFEDDFVIQNRETAGAIYFQTNNSERLRITSDGKLGLGTSSPGALLSLYAGANSEYFRGGGNGTTARDLVFSATTGTNPGDTHTLNASSSTGQLILSTASTPRMLIDASGRVGIGTTSPGYPLTVNNNSATYNRVLQLTSANTDTLIGFGTSGGSSELAPEIGASGTGLQFNTQNTPRMTIAAGGNVGIGTTAPTTNLHIRATGTPLLRIQDDDGTDQYSDFYNSAGQSSYNAVNGAGVKGAHIFLQGGSESARIDSSGRLLVGTSSGFTFSTNSNTGISHSQLVGVGTDETGSHAIVQCNQGGASRGPSLILAKNRSSSTTLGTVLNSENLGEVSFQGSAASAFVRAASIRSDQDGGTPSSTSMAGRLVFSTTADGASTPTERLRIASTGAFGLSGANYGTSGQVLTSNGSSAAPTWQNAGAGLFTSYAILAHVEPDGTDGGSSVQDTWTTRTINTEVADPDGIVTLSSNQFTLGAGSYLIEWACVAQATSVATSRLYDSTNTAAIQNSLVLQTSTTYAGSATSAGSARVSPTGSTAYEIQMNTNNSNASDGFGLDNPATGAGDEVYLFVKIYKES